MSTTTPDSLKAAGNAHYSDRRYAEAISAYRAALELAPDSALKGILLLNISAACLAQRDWSGALDASQAAIDIDRSLTKAHFRKGAALTSLGRLSEAVAALKEGVKVDPKNSALLAALREAEDEQWRSDASSTITSLEGFAAVFGRTSRDVRLRLATLATLWNVLDQDARCAAFTRLLEVLLGPDAVTMPPPPGHAGAHISDYDLSLLAPLPMSNYADVSVPEPWISFFKSLPGASQVQALEAAWSACDATEQRLIITDIKSFFAEKQSADGELAIEPAE